MTNPLFACPAVKCKVGGQDFELRMDFNAISLAESVTGRNLMDDAVWKNMDVLVLTALFWACVAQTSHLTLTDIRSASFKDAAGMADAVRAAWRAANALPAEEARPTDGSTGTSPQDSVQ